MRDKLEEILKLDSFEEQLDRLEDLLDESYQDGYDEGYSDAESELQ